MFGRSDSSDAAYEKQMRERQARLAVARATSDRIREGLLIQAKAAELEAIERKPALMALAEADHVIDKKNYLFQCKRWGDFLALFIARRCLITRKPEQAFKEFKWSTTVNLGKTTKIDLKEGNAPDLTGKLGYKYSVKRNDDGGDGWSGDPPYHSDFPGILMPAPEGTHYVVEPRYPIIPCARWPYNKGDDSDLRVYNGGRYGGHYGGDSVTGLTTKDYVNRAHDDVLVFVGSDMSINMPGGTGAAIRDAILSECGRAWGVALRSAAEDLK